MGGEVSADSRLRRAVKSLVARTLPESAYVVLRALVAARDITSGAWAEPELDLIGDALWPGEIAIDVGAHFGLWSYHLSRRVGPAGRVYAFEPIPQTYAILRQTLRWLRCRNVAGYPFAVGAEPGLVQMRVPRQSNGAAASGQACLAIRHDARPGREQHARFDTADIIDQAQATLEFLDDEPVPFLKLDIEGGELFALRGATRLLERWHPTIVCEINPWFVAGFQHTAHDVVACLADFDYTLYRYVAHQLVPWDADWIEEANYVFVHPSRLERLCRLMMAPNFRRPA